MKGTKDMTMKTKNKFQSPATDEVREQKQEDDKQY